MNIHHKIDFRPVTPDLFDHTLGAISRALRLPPLLHEVRGDTMDPTFRDGDIAIVDRAQQRLTREGLWLLSFGEGLEAVRRIHPGGGRALVICDNPAYETEQVGYGDLRVVGRVVGRIGRV